MRTIKLTDEQAEFLEKLLEHEMTEEFVFQADGAHDPEYYETVLNLYKAIQKKPRNFMEAFVLDDIIGDREKELEELRRQA